MATFTNLHDVGGVLASTISTNLDPALALIPVMVGPPLDDPNSPNDHVRISLMWFTEQPSHVNDPYNTEFDGRRTPPPLTLSSFFLITCYGTDVQGAPVVAQQLLGSVLRTMHANKRLVLPLPAQPALGDGGLDVDLYKITPELQEKLWGPLQLRHRTYALYEVGPVQLVSIDPQRPPAPLVSPGGVVLSGPDPVSPPSVRRVVPAMQATNGRLRIDGDFPAGADAIWVGQVVFDPALITVIEPGVSVSIELGASPLPLAAGASEVTLVSGAAASPAEPIGLTEPAAVSLDPPLTTRWPRTTDLVLTGRALAGGTELVAWPEAGVTSPADVHHLPLSAVTATQVTVAAAGLAPLRTEHYRLSLHHGAHLYTSAIVLEFTP